MNSVLSQDYEKIKIIVSDDCSTDGTVDLIKEYSKKYPKKIIPLFSDRNLGLTQNIDRATKHCEGKYISHLGGDDIMLKDKISSQVEFMERNPDCSICYHDVLAFDSDTKQTLYYFSKSTVWKEYLETRQRVNLKIMDAVEELGLGISIVDIPPKKK